MTKSKKTDPYVTVCKTSDIAPGAVRVFAVGDHDVAVANADGQFYAFADVCTHDGGPLAQGDLEGCIIACPRHGARFDIVTGRALSLPAVVPIPVYDLLIVGDEIRVSRQPK